MPPPALRLQPFLRCFQRRQLQRQQLAACSASARLWQPFSLPLSWQSTRLLSSYFQGVLFSKACLLASAESFMLAIFESRFCFPCFKFGLCRGFTNAPFFYSAFQVLHQEHTLFGKDTADGVSGLCAHFQPIQGTVKLQVNSGRRSVGVVRSNFFCKATITWCSYVCNNDAVEGVALTSVTLQSNFCCHN